MSNNKTPIVFKGRTSDYFGIWIVNLLLSIFTLGIYSAWAKVRRKKYFYNNTLIDGVGFDYHANPIAILKGRIIAFILFVLYQVLAAFSPIAAGVLFVLFLIALPWIVIRGLMFNARNSSHRGLRFDFDGKYGEAALVFIGYTLLSIVTLGLAIPFVAQRTNKFIVDHHKFGTSHFKMEALVRDFYKIYLIIFLIPLIGILAAVAIPAYQQYVNKAKQAQVQPISQNLYQEINAGGFVKVANTEAVEMAADSADAEEIASQEAIDAEETEGYAQDASEEALLKDLTPEERAEYDKLMKAFEGEATAENAEDYSDDEATTPTKKDPVAEYFTNLATTWGVAAAIIIGISAMLLYLVFIFSFIAYFKSRIQNLVLNNTTLDHISFSSTQRMRDLLWLYISNALVLMFTMGFATPWAQIRMARYRLEHLMLVGEPDLDKFVGEKKESARALGEEVADFFDVDLSFG